MPRSSAMLASAVRRRLEAEPRTTLASIARELRVERHTLSRALLKECRAPFRVLQARALEQTIGTALGRPGILIKQIAYDLGYRSPACLTRRVKALFAATPSALRSRVGRER